MPALLQRCFHQPCCPWEHAGNNYVLGAEAIAVDFPSLLPSQCQNLDQYHAFPLKQALDLPDSSDLVEHSELEARGPISSFVIAETVEGGVLIIGFCNAFVIQLRALIGTKAHSASIFIMRYLKEAVLGFYLSFQASLCCCRGPETWKGGDWDPCSLDSV